MKCTAQVSNRNFLYVPCPLLLIRPHLSLDSFQKVGLLARPAGGAVEKNGQLVSSVTPYTTTVKIISNIYMCKPND